jgi:hypothetical protein
VKKRSFLHVISPYLIMVTIAAVLAVLEKNHESSYGRLEEEVRGIPDRADEIAPALEREIASTRDRTRGDVRRVESRLSQSIFSGQGRLMELSGILSSPVPQQTVEIPIPAAAPASSPQPASVSVSAWDSSEPVFDVVDRGAETSYSDIDSGDQGRYLYRVRKIKEEKTFDASEAVLGVSSATCRDDLEPNDMEDTATALEYDRTANLYFKVYPNPDEFISDPTLAGGTTICYTVSRDSISQL